MLSHASPSRVAWLRSPYLLLSLSSLFWAGNFIVGRALRADVPPIALSFWRWTLALALLLPLSLPVMRRHRGAVRAAAPLLVALGVVGVACFQSFVYVALQSTPALNGLLFLSLTPIVIALLTWLGWHERPTLRQGLGIALSLLGALAVIARGEGAALAALRLHSGDVWMLAAVGAWALYSVLLQRYRPAGLPALALLCGSVAVGWLCLLPVYAWTMVAGQRIVLGGGTLLGLGYVGLFPSVLAFLCWNQGVAAVGANVAGLFLHLMPLFGALLAVPLLSEPLAPYHLAGAALIFSGIALARR